MLSGRVIDKDNSQGIVGALRGVVRRLGEPVIRVALSRAVRQIGARFLLGRTIDEAISNGADARKDGYTFPYGMLGEAARIEGDAQRHHGAYSKATSAIYLHPRYDYGQ